MNYYPRRSSPIAGSAIFLLLGNIITCSYIYLIVFSKAPGGNQLFIALHESFINHGFFKTMMITLEYMKEGNVNVISHVVAFSIGSVMSLVCAFRLRWFYKNKRDEFIDEMKVLGWVLLGILVFVGIPLFVLVKMLG